MLFFFWVFRGTGGASISRAADDAGFGHSATCSVRWGNDRHGTRDSVLRPAGGIVHRRITPFSKRSTRPDQKRSGQRRWAPKKNKQRVEHEVGAPLSTPTWPRFHAPSAVAVKLSPVAGLFSSFFLYRLSLSLSLSLSLLPSASRICGVLGNV